MRAAIAAAVAFAVIGACAAPTAHAESLRYCDDPPRLSAAEQGRLLSLAFVVRSVLSEAGDGAALVSRSGLALERLGQRYSHAGVALPEGTGSWSVRQLYYACDERLPRLYDQGLAGFVMGLADPARGRVSVLLLPAGAAQPLATAARDARGALQLLGARYSANAYPWATRYQNCNQWVAELLAAAWGEARIDGRADAQAWLARQGFEGTLFEVGALMALTPFVPWVQRDDHPEEDLAAARFRVAMPASIEAFVLRQWPQARRVEVCLEGERLVVRRGEAPLDGACTPGPGDECRALP